MVDRRTLRKNARRLKLGRCYAYLDNLIVSIFYFYDSAYISSPFIDGYSDTNDLISHGYDGDHVSLFVGWVTWILIIYTLGRYISGNQSLSKKQLKTKDLVLFLISVVVLAITVVISPFLENSILWKVDDTQTHLLMMRLYYYYGLFMVYTFIRWLRNFDYHEYYYYRKGDNYNRKFFLYLFFVVIGLSVVYEVGLETLKRYLFN